MNGMALRMQLQTHWLRAAFALLVLLAVALGIATRGMVGAPTGIERLVGTPAPLFALVPAQVASRGQTQQPPATPVTLASQRGHAVLLLFAYSLCPHCLTTAEAVRQVQRDTPPAGHALRVLTIDSPAEAPAIAVAYQQRLGLDTPPLLDAQARVATRYGIQTYPAVVLIDATGVVRRVWTGETSATALRQGIATLAH